MKSYSFLSRIFAMTLFLLTSYSYSQIQNSNENTVTSIFNNKANSIDFSGANTNINIRIFEPFEQRYVKDSASNRISAVKVNQLFFKFGITETKKLVKFDDIDFKKKNGLISGIKFVHSFDTLYPVAKGKTNNNLWLFKGEINVSYRRLEVLDTVNNVIDTKSPVALNFNGSAGYFVFNFTSEKFYLYPQGTINIDAITYNKNVLKGKFDRTTTATINDGILIKDDESFDGTVGDFSNTEQKYNTTLSLNLITDWNQKKFPNLMCNLYSDATAFSYLKPAYNLGTSISVLGKSIFKEIKGQNKKLFTPPSFLSFGVDWNFQSGKKASKPNFLLSGSFNIE